MKRNILMIVLLVLIFTYSASYTSASKDSGEAIPVPMTGVKMGYVDLNSVLNKCGDGKVAKAKLEAKGKILKKELEGMQNELKKIKEDLDKQRYVLSPEALRAKEALFQTKYIELTKRTADYEKQFAGEESMAIKPITDKISRIIKDVGQRSAYTVIISTKEAALYLANGIEMVDLTSKVIKEYDSSRD